METQYHEVYLRQLVEMNRLLRIIAEALEKIGRMRQGV